MSARVESWYRKGQGFTRPHADSIMICFVHWNSWNSVPASRHIYIGPMSHSALLRWQAYSMLICFQPSLLKDLIVYGTYSLYKSLNLCGLTSERSPFSSITWLGKQTSKQSCISFIGFSRWAQKYHGSSKVIWSLGAIRFQLGYVACLLMPI